ncbi:GntR family transcriptional regulator [Streptomyces sulphureus]|uniref:GntR family transcriptional regulator n=1 Tax=Streptomyces sulphureus TaxID=47758 RepID=UPI0003A5A2F5|nr:GntR family transcriptional regulator [Streptomyces sulphureus]
MGAFPARRARPQLSEEAASYLRDLITSGTLAPGTRVRAEVVSAEMGISSTPAREALQALRAEGFLSLEPRRGFTVASMTGDDIRDIFLAQSFVAGELAARAAERVDPEQVSRLQEIHEALIAAAAEGESAAQEEWNHKFHRELNLIADAPRLAWVVGLLSRYVPRRFYASIEGWSRTTVEDHAGLLTAVLEGDSKAARIRMVEHIHRAGEQLAQHIDERLAAGEVGTDQATG